MERARTWEQECLRQPGGHHFWVTDKGKREEPERQKPSGNKKENQESVGSKLRRSGQKKGEVR